MLSPSKGTVTMKASSVLPTIVHNRHPSVIPGIKSYSSYSGQPAYVLQWHTLLVVQRGGEQHKEDVDITITEMAEQVIKVCSDGVMFFLFPLEHEYFNRRGRIRYSRDPEQFDLHNFTRNGGYPGKFIDEHVQMLS